MSKVLSIEYLNNTLSIRLSQLAPLRALAAHLKR